MSEKLPDRIKDGDGDVWVRWYDDVYSPVSDADPDQAAEMTLDEIREIFGPVEEAAESGETPGN